MRLGRKINGVVFVLLAFPAVLLAQPKSASPSSPARGVHIAQMQGRGQLEVDGVPFFIHGSAFPYFRLPADLWERSLEEYRALGINTIDLRIPWNWHEVRPGEFDFAGRTNPRRDLRRLLRLIAEKELKLIVRPAASISEWRNSGEPDGQVGSDPRAREAPLNRFVASLALELKTYQPTSTISIPDRESKEGAEKVVSGSLILVALPTPSARETLRAAGIDVPAFFPDSLPLPGDGMRSAELPPPAPRSVRSAPGLPIQPRVYATDASAIELAAANLAAQPGFPELISNVPLGIPAPADDVRPVEISFDEPLLRSRLVLGQGVGGIIYEAIQDSLAPSGFAGARTNPFARIDVALDVNASRYPGARSVVRSGQLLEVWGTFLASSHKRADFAVALGAPSQEASLHWQQISQTARAAGVSITAVDPQRQDVNALLRNPVVVWNTLLTAPLPDTAQTTLLEYAQRGGTLVIFPERPASAIFAPVWAAPEAPPGQRTVGSGKVVYAADDPFAADKWEQSVGEPANRAGVEAIQQWLQAAGRRPILSRKNSTEASLVMSQLVNNSGARQLGDRTREAAAGLLSVTNLSGETVEEELEMISPRVGARAGEGTVLRLPLTVPPHESLLLPLHAPLCSEPGKKACDDEIIVAGAEFLRAQREGKQLELTFFAPMRAVVRLRFQQQPSRVRADEMSVVGIWTPATREFEITIPRGPAPEYLRVVRIQLPYEPRVREKPDPEKSGRRDYDFSVADGMRFPLASDTALETFPPLIALKSDHTGRMVMQGRNYDLMGRGIDFRITGPIRGADELGLDAGELGFERIDLKPADNGSAPREFGLLEGLIEARSGRDRRNLPVAFVAVEEKRVANYQFDFERDGPREWVLEDEHLRMIASPERGGRIVALIDKQSGLSLATILGFLRDSVTDTTADAPPPRDLGFQEYMAEWLPDGQNKALRLESRELQALKIVKSIHITGQQAFEVRYRWEGPALLATTVSTALTVPVTLHGENTTRFCWEKPKPEIEPSKAAPGSAPEMHCEVFEPAGKPVTVPAGIGLLEVRTPGSFVLRLEWPGGQMRVEMKNYSAWLHLDFPRPQGNAPAGEGLLKFRAVVVE